METASPLPTPWIESNGGPLLLLPAELAPKWRGIDDLPGAPSDYERACEVDDYLGNIAVGPGEGVVLGDEPLSTLWRPSDDASGGVLVRWRYGEDEDHSLLGHIPSLEFETTDVVLVAESGRVALFDSAFRGTEFEVGRSGEWLVLPPGHYRLGIREWQPHSRAALLLHHLARA